MSLNNTSFRKFTELNQPEDNNKHKIIEKEETNIPKEKNVCPKSKSSYLKRKPKDLDYKECKSDIAHILYLNHRVQTKVRHNLIPNLNLERYALPSASDLAKYKLPYCTLVEPRPVYFANKHCEIIDKCFRRTLDREHHRKRLSHARTKFQTTLEKDRKLRKLTKEQTYHPSLYTFAERLECDPDPFFYGNYDFYYTGGNICTLNKKCRNVLHVDDEDSSTIKSSIFPSEECLSETVLRELESIKLPTNTEVFELSQMENVNNFKNLVGARQLNNLTIISVEPGSGKLKLLTEFKTKSSPFISFAQSFDYPELLTISSMKQHVRLYDISKKLISVKNLYKMQQKDADYNGISWNCIRSWDKQTFLYANDRHLAVMDFRTPEKDWLNTCCTFSSKEFPCDFISSLTKSNFSNLFYMGTNHTLRCLDIRFLGQRKHFKNLTVCEWTHQLDYPAVFLDTCLFENREIIACASPLAGDLRLCELSRSKQLENVDSNGGFFVDSEFTYKSFCLPWQPPTIQEAYESACLSGNALQPEAKLRQRIRCCTTGLSFFNSLDSKNEEILLLQANSNGDIYAQNMYKRKSHPTDQQTNTRSNDIMADYALKLSKLPQPNLNYSDIVDMKAMRKVLLCPALDNPIEEENDEISDSDTKEKPELKYRFKGRWQKSMSTLHKYKDALAQDLLSIWDIPFEEELDIKLSTLKTKFKKEKDSKDILKWLHNDEIQAPTTKIPMANLTMSSIDIDNEMQDITRDKTNLNESNLMQISASNYLGEENFLNSRSKPKIAKPKKKHVKGF